jgi:hypothetical protein
VKLTAIDERPTPFDEHEFYDIKPTLPTPPLSHELLAISDRRTHIPLPALTGGIPLRNNRTKMERN